jgi:hypothetical protein
MQQRDGEPLSSEVGMSRQLGSVVDDNDDVDSIDLWINQTGLDADMTVLKVVTVVDKSVEDGSQFLILLPARCGVTC